MHWKTFADILLNLIIDNSEDCDPFESCNYCDKYLQPNWEYCPFCGERVDGYK